MTTALKMLTGIFGFLMLAIAASFIIDPVTAGKAMKIEATSTLGLHTIRGDIGALFLAIGGFALLGLRRGSRHWLLVAATLPGLVAILRVTSYFVNGPDEGWIPPIILEVVMITLFLATYKAAE